MDLNIFLGRAAVILERAEEPNPNGGRLEFNRISAGLDALALLRELLPRDVRRLDPDTRAKRAFRPRDHVDVM